MSGEKTIDEIMRVRGFNTLPSYYKSMEPYPRLLDQFWHTLKAAMGPGHLDIKTKEMIAIAVCVAMGARYGIDSHILTAKKVGVTDAELEEVFMIVNAFAQTAMICSALNPPLKVEDFS